MRLAALSFLLALSLARAQRPAPTPIDKAIEEFRIQTRELGLRNDSPRRNTRAPGAQARFHGRLFENFRNDFLDAVPHEIRQRGGSKSLLRRNQFGFNAGGPVVIPRLYHGGRNTYFSFSYEGVRERISRTLLRTVPIIPERAGDFSATVDQAGAPLPIYDPATTRPNPDFDPRRSVSAANLQHARLPFPANRVPASRLDPVAARGLPLYPEPNTDAGPFFRNNYFIHSPETNLANGILARLDHALRERHRLQLDLAYSDGFLAAARHFPSRANPGPTDRVFQSRRASIEHIFTASTHSVNTLSFSAATSQSRNQIDGGRTTESFPQYLFPPYLSMGRGYPISKNASQTFAAAESFSTRRGRHALRVRAQHARYQVNTFWPQYPSGSFRFSPGLTSLPGVVNTGHAFASFVLGMAEYAEASVVASPSYFRRSAAGVALRDQYEIRKGLTLSAALNVERNTPRVEKYNRQSTVDLGTGLLTAASARGRSFQPALVRVEPSLGLAWNPRGSARTVLRASFARSYSPIPIYAGQWGTQGFTASPAYISPNIQLEPAVTLAAGLPPYTAPVPDLRPEAAFGTVADLIDRTTRVPTYQSASLSVERELPASTLLTAGCAYSGGRNLLVSNGAANPNAIPLDALSFRDRLNDEEFNRSLRPYPQYKGFDVYSSYPGGRYQREAAFLRLEKRASMGLSFSAYYEFSKQLDDYSGPYGKQDYYRRELEWALTAGAEPHRVQFSYVYELPLGPGKSWLDYQDWRRYLTDGWSLSGMAALATGNPIYLRPQFNNTGGVVAALSVNAVPGVDPHLAAPGPALWFNPAAFDQPPDFSIGSVSRTHPSLRNPGNQNFDLSLNKRLALDAGHALEFSAAGFNFLNHGDWNDPDNVIGPAHAPNVNAGRIIGSHGGRVVQLGLRFTF